MSSDEIAPWHYNHPDNIRERRERYERQHELAPLGRQGMRGCTKCGEVEPEDGTSCPAPVESAG